MLGSGFSRWLCTVAVVVPLMSLRALADFSGHLPIHAEKSATSSFYIPPIRIVWTSGNVKGAEQMLRSANGQPTMDEPVPPMVLKPGCSVIFDFGKEINGSVQLVTPANDVRKVSQVRVRFGESVGETMASMGEKGAGNEHAVRDQIVRLPSLGATTIGPGGFRFVRLDNADPHVDIRLSQVRGVLTIRDVPYVGSFQCSDERLTQVWNTGAYTVHLNMQEYLWSGIKRDRMVWVGDMAPETGVINAVFGYNEVVPVSLDLVRDATPASQWMQGNSLASMWWVMIQEDWYLHHGDLEYLTQQKPYLISLMRRLATCVGPDGREQIDGPHALNVASGNGEPAVHEGKHAILSMTLESGARLSRILGEEETAAICEGAVARMKQYPLPGSGKKGATALAGLAGYRDIYDVVATLKAHGAEGFSGYEGYFVLNALAEAGEHEAAIDLIRDYWGTMIDYGATTFWENFEPKWTDDAARIDEVVPPGKKDLHGDFGSLHQAGFRRSLCHGSSAGPTAWLSRNVLGVIPVAPGCAKVRIVPNLGKLAWAEGTFPTPRGPIHVRHEKQSNGSVKTTLKLPPGIVEEK